MLSFALTIDDGALLYEFIQRMGKDSLVPHWIKTDYLDDLYDEHKTLLAIKSNDGKKLLSLLILQDLGEAELLYFFTDEAHRRQGWGRKLLTQSQSLFNAMFLEVSIHNQAAIALYQGLGFYQTGLRQGYYQHDGSAAMLMEWRQDG